jgi:hypothetical protein
MSQPTLPGGWRWAKLGDPRVVSVIMGQSPPGSSYNKRGTTRLVELFLIPLSSAALHVILLKEGYFELTQKMTAVDILCRSYHVFPQLALADIPPAVPACRFAHSCLHSPSDFQNSTVLI